MLILPVIDTAVVDGTYLFIDVDHPRDLSLECRTSRTFFLIDLTASAGCTAGTNHPIHNTVNVFEDINLPLPLLAYPLIA